MRAAFTVQDLLAAGRVQALAVAPGGAWIALEIARHDDERAALVSHIHRVDLETGRTTQLTRGAHGCSSPAFRADGSLAFLSTRPAGAHAEVEPGDERAQVWVLPEHGEAAPVTDEPLGVTAFRFARAADVLVAMTLVLPGVAHEDQRRAARELATKGPTSLRYAAMPVRQWDHWLGRAAPHLAVYDASGRRDLTPDADRELRAWALPHASSLAVSSDGTLVYSEWVTPAADRAADVRIVAIDTRTGARRDRVVVEPSGTATTPVLSPDGRTLACRVQRRSAERHGEIELTLVETATGDRRAAAAELDLWLVPEDFSPDGSQLVCTADVRADVAVYGVDVATGRAARLTAEAAHGTHASVRVHPGGRSVLGLRHTLLAPPEPFQMPLRPASEPFVVARASGVEAQPFDVSRHETAAEDGERVEWLLVRPRGVPRPPVLFWIHGGPIGQFADGWHWRWCPLAFASAGFAVVLPNPRGSTGRGQAFVEGIWGNAWGATCYADLMRVADDVGARADLDGRAIVAMGGSFGGYMANWIGSQTDRFRAIVTHASIFHMEAFAQTTDVPAWFYVEMGCAPPEGRDELDRFSPHRRVSAWKTPTLVIHGEKDYRVPIGEALSLFESLQRRGVESELLVFPDEGHWILRPRNVVAWYEAVLDFVRRHTGR